MTVAPLVAPEIQEEEEASHGYKNPMLVGLERTSAYKTTDGQMYSTRKEAHLAQATINFTELVTEAFPEAQAEGNLVEWLIENQKEVRSFLNLVAKEV